MSNYKRISELEEISAVQDGATVPVLDGDGVMKRISAAGIGGGNGTPIIFKISGDQVVDDQGELCSSWEAVVDAYFANRLYLCDLFNPGSVMMPSGFYISGDIAYVTNTSANHASYISVNDTLENYRAAVSKYIG